ncbi:gram-negative porin family protein, partial [Vibrio harveyi]
DSFYCLNTFIVLTPIRCE